jgi:shikimate kinase
MNIILTGIMGTGKTTVGKLLAKKLGWAFYDTDSMIEKETGLTIPQIFAKRGEEPFRLMEMQTVQLLSVLDGIVVATGGGVPMRKENMDALEKNGWIVHLSARPETILERLDRTIATRPLLLEGDPLLSLEKILNERKKVYARNNVNVVTDEQTPEQVAYMILKLRPETVKK